MGVQGLWTLLQPVGKRVNVETLSNKKVAVDASIWLIQFMKAMRDEKGEMLRNAHVMGFFRRICRLLFHKIRPVFVFDGATPALKRATTAARRRRREQQGVRLKKTAEKLLVSRLKKHALKQAMKGQAGSSEPSNKSSAQEAPDDAEVQIVEEEDTATEPKRSEEGGMAGARTAASSKEGYEEDVVEVSEDEDDGEFLLPDDMNSVDPTVLSTLPPSIQLEVMQKMKEHKTAENREKFHHASRAPSNFSQLQLQTYLQGCSFRKQMDGIKGKMNAAHSASGKGKGKRIASERNREYILATTPEGPSTSSILGGGGAGGSSSLPFMSGPANVELSNKQEGDEEARDKTDPKTEESLDIKVELNKELSSEDDLFGSDDNSQSEVEWETVQGGDEEGPGSFDEGKTTTSLHWRQRASQRQKFWSRTHGFQMGRKLGDWSENSNNQAAATTSEHQPVQVPSGREIEDYELARAIELSQADAQKAKNDTGEDEAEGDDVIFEDVHEEKGPSSSSRPLTLTPAVCEKTGGINGIAYVSKEEETEIEIDYELAKAIELSQADMQKGVRNSPEDDAAACEKIITDQGGKGGKKRKETVVEEGNNVNEASQSKAKDSPSKAPNQLRDKDDSAPAQKRVRFEFEEGLEDGGDQEVEELVEKPMEKPIQDIDTDTDGNDDQPSVVAPEDSQAAASRDDDEDKRVATSKGFHTEDEGGEQPLSNRSGSHLDEEDPAANKDKGQQENVVELSDNDDDTCIVVEERETNSNQPTVAGGGGGRISPPKQPSVTRENLEEKIHLIDENIEQLTEEYRRNVRYSDEPTSEMYAECQELLTMFGIPYIIAPMEAEAQCAYLNKEGLVDGVVTDDSDAFLFGAKNVYRNIFESKKYVEEYKVEDIERELGLSRENLIEMAMLLGSDYTEGVYGVGIVNAIEIVNEFSGTEGLKKFRAWVEKFDSNKLYNGNKRSVSEDGNATDFMRKHSSIRKNWDVPNDFPNEKVMMEYRSPKIDLSKDTFRWGKPDMQLLLAFCAGKFNWTHDKTTELLSPVLKAYEAHEMQMTLESFFGFSERFAKFRSARIEKAVKKLKKSKKDK